MSQCPGRNYFPAMLPERQFLTAGAGFQAKVVYLGKPETALSDSNNIYETNFCNILLITT